MFLDTMLSDTPVPAIVPRWFAGSINLHCDVVRWAQYHRIAA